MSQPETLQDQTLGILSRDAGGWFGRCELEPGLRISVYLLQIADEAPPETLLKPAGQWFRRLQTERHVLALEAARLVVESYNAQFNEAEPISAAELAAALIPISLQLWAGQVEIMYADDAYLGELVLGIWYQADGSVSAGLMGG